MPETSLERGLTRSGILVAAGLLAQIVVSSWAHPLAFVAFLLIACPLVVAGMALFLWSLVAG